MGGEVGYRVAGGWFSWGYAIENADVSVVVCFGLTDTPLSGEQAYDPEKSKYRFVMKHYFNPMSRAVTTHWKFTELGVEHYQVL